MCVIQDARTGLHFCLKISNFQSYLNCFDEKIKILPGGKPENAYDSRSEYFKFSRALHMQEKKFSVICILHLQDLKDLFFIKNYKNKIYTNTISAMSAL